MAQDEQEYAPYDSAEQVFQQEDVILEDIPDKNDEMPYVQRLWSNDSMQLLKKDPGLGYMEYIDSVLRSRQKQRDKLPEQTPIPFEESIFDLGWLRGLMWGIAIAAVLFLVWKLLFGSGAAFARNKRISPPGAEAIAEQTSHKSFEQEAAEAASSGNFRLAVRYHYLHVLDALADRHLIIMAPQKTNIQYQQELYGKAMAGPFATLLLQYEYVWFGEFALKADQYEKVSQNFKAFQRQWL